METLRTFHEIDVKLISAISQPYELAVATARTCYSGKGVIFPNDVSKDEKAIQLRDRIAESTKEAGHLTTRQHAHFVFAISGLSRHCIWSFLHSHPFYNSEQVSQRYVRVKPNNFVMPPLPEKAMPLYRETVGMQMATYEGLLKTLRPTISGEYYDRFKSRKKYAEKWDSSVDKRCFEIARYALGVGTTAYLYHTVSALTLLRYAKLVRLFETPHEQKILIEKMLAAVKAQDPLFEKELPDVWDLEKTAEFTAFQNFRNGHRQSSEPFIREFDASLEGKTSKLLTYTRDADTALAVAVRTALGRTRQEMSDNDALSLVLDPKSNPILADTMGATTLDRLSQALHHVQFTFQKKISHTADSQDQRHRMVFANRPVMHFHYSGKPDYILPFAFTQNAEAQEQFTSCMEKTFASINQLLDMGVTEEFAFYLLPNAFPIRMVSTGDLLAYQHKWKMRSCYNAQEEIFRATIDELQQVSEIFPKIGEHLRAPCYLRLRANITPFCPEGDHYCGLPVWKYGLSDYQRKSL